MSMKSQLCVLGLLVSAFTAAASGNDPEYDFFGFRISAGYQVGVGLKSKLQSVVPSSASSKQTAYTRATGVTGQYYSDDGGFVCKDDGGGDATKTTYWQVPASAVTVNGADTVITLDNSFQDTAQFMTSDDAVTHGAHIELSATIGHDEDWGLDVFVGFAWMTGIDCLKSYGTASDNAGTYRTLGHVSTADLMSQGYLDWSGAPTGSTIGPGRPWQMGDGPQISTTLGEPSLVPGSGGSTSCYVEGDYDEYDIYCGFRLWYLDDDLPWFKVTSTIGFGVDYGDFDCMMSATGPGGVSARRSVGESDWDLYGLLGLGVMMNFWDFDISLDALWRYGQNSLRIDSPYLKGEIERPDFIFRASLGYNF